MSQTKNDWINMHLAGKDVPAKKKRQDAKRFVNRMGDNVFNDWCKLHNVPEYRNGTHREYYTYDLLAALWEEKQAHTVA